MLTANVAVAKASLFNLSKKDCMNYFELFALSTSYELDKTSLKSKYLELQRAVHPDNFANGTERERLLAMQKSAQINDGFETLKNIDTRAQHLLMLNGIELAHETQTLKDPMFLMQQMELRETLEDIPSESDPEQSLLDFQNQITVYINAINTKFSTLFTDGSDAALLTAGDEVRKLKFMLKLSQEAIALEEKIFDY